MNALKPDNAVILAAGFASRFAPLSYTIPKALLPVRGEILIERQIRQLKAAGISDIYVVTGHLAERFSYLAELFNVHLIKNTEYQTRNNHSSIWAARDVLANTYICSSDNYFTQNVFSAPAERPYYSALYADGQTAEYCLTTDPDGRITGVTIGGSDSWYMLGHVLFDEAFSHRLLSIIEQAYDLPATKDKLWEHLYMEHLDTLTLYIRKYPQNVIYEFDNVQELSQFDPAFSDWYQRQLV